MVLNSSTSSRKKNLLGNGQENLLLLDLHSSHLFNAKFMHMMLEHNVEVCSFPPHCTHVLQALDNVPYVVLKQKYQMELLTYNFKVAGAKMNPMQLFQVLVPAFTQAFSPDNIRKGFQQTGIYPIDPTVDKLKDLGPSIITDKCKSRVVCCPVDYLIDSFQVLSDLLDLFLDFQVEFMASGSAECHTIKQVKFLIDFYLFFQMPIKSKVVLQVGRQQQKVRMMHKQNKQL